MVLPLARTPNPFAKPRIKVILVKQTLEELQLMLDDDWKIASTMPHAQGALLVLVKE